MANHQSIDKLVKEMIKEMIEESFYYQSIPIKYTPKIKFHGIREIECRGLISSPAMRKAIVSSCSAAGETQYFYTIIDGLSTHTLSDSDLEKILK